MKVSKTLIAPALALSVLLPLGAPSARAEVSHGASVASETTVGNFTTFGAVRSTWLAQGGSGGILGQPTSNEEPVSGGIIQHFQGGLIAWSSATGARIVRGAVGGKWKETGAAASYLGFPTGNEVGGLRNGGVYQNFQGGAILWSPATGAIASPNGSIRSAWAQSGFENGRLGYPASDVVRGLRSGGAYQNYQGGAIVFSPATGAQLSVGAIRDLWAQTGFENGGLGYPTGNEVGGLRNGGVYQNYQGGAIIAAPGAGVHLSVGGIRQAWASQGFENGRLGYPTSDEFPIAGGVQQNYQGGSIVWTGGRAVISYPGTAAPAVDNSPAGAQAFAKTVLAQKGLSGDYQCLVDLWNHESGWNYQAQNASSGAFGIPQALPGDKMATAGGDWKTNARTQVIWGIDYITGRYGAPCGALNAWNSKGWY